MRRELTAEWIDEQITAIFRSHAKDDVDRAIPVLLLLMARDFGFENLRPEIQDGVRRVATKIGLFEGMDEDEAKAKTVVYVHNLQVKPELLEQVKRVFDTHYTARAEDGAAGFRRLLRAKRDLAPAVGAPVVRSDDSIMSAELVRRATGIIRS